MITDLHAGSVDELRNKVKSWATRDTVCAHARNRTLRVNLIDLVRPPALNRDLVLAIAQVNTRAAVGEQNDQNEHNERRHCGLVAHEAPQDDLTLA